MESGFTGGRDAGYRKAGPLHLEPETRLARLMLCSAPSRLPMPNPSKKAPAILLCALLVGVATESGSRATEPPRADSTVGAPVEAAAPPWVEGPGARVALDSLWAAKPFELDGATLARASGGSVPRMHDQETLLNEVSVRLNAQGGSEDTSRVVWRILSDDPHQTVSWTWAPWRQEKPQVRARVVSPSGTETRLDPSTIVEGAVVVDDLEISDVHRLQIPLPNALRGSVVELEVTTISRRGLLDGAGRSWSTQLWTFAPIRKRRYRVEAPEGVPLGVDAVGVTPPPIRVEGGVQRIELEVGELPFRPYQMTQQLAREKQPQFGWSTARSWNDIAVQYWSLIRPVLLEKAELKHLRLPPEPSTTQKVQAVLRAMREQLRYTAVHLGDGAIVPTRPSVVLQRGYGDCKDLAVLLVAALRELGVDASVALTVVDGPIPRDDLPGIEAFNHMVVVVRNGDERLWVDPTAPDYPVGVMPPGSRDHRALIVEPATQGLVSTPTADETPEAFRVVYDLRLSSFGPGDATVTSSGEGAAEGTFRSTLARCDETEARKIIQGDVQLLFGDAPYETRVSACKPGDGPVVVTAVFKATRALDTGDRMASISLPSRVPDDLVPERVRGKPPGSDQRDDASRKEEQRQLQERTGLTADEVENVPFKLDARASSERVYRVTLPAHFVAAALPASRTLKLGPSTLTEGATRVDDRTVEVSFRYEVDRTDWSVEDVRAFRAAYWKRYEELMPTLVARFEPAQLIVENRTPEAVRLVHRWLTEQPRDGLTRARWARALLLLGLNEVARDEAERAWRDTPEEVLVNLVRGDAARHNRFGLLYHSSFERADAIQAFRKAMEHDPNHNWGAGALADTLRRNDEGELEIDWTPDVAAAASVLQGLVDRGVASSENQEMLAEVYMRGRRREDLIRLSEKDPASRSPSDAQLQVMMAAMVGGVDAALAAIRRADTPQAQLVRLALALATFAQMERYEEARTLIEAFQPGPALAQLAIPLQAMARALRPVPDGAVVRDPVSAARSVVGLAARASTRTALSGALARLASASGRAELDGNARLFRLIQVPELEPRANWVWLYHGGNCTPTAAGRATRVRCEVPEYPEISLTTYWTRDGEELRLESLGSVRQLAAEAREAAAANRLDEAEGWINWILDRVLADKDEQSPMRLLRDYWGQVPHGDPAAVRFAAAQASVLSETMAKDADASVLTELERGRATLTGSLRRRFDVLLAQVHTTRKEWRSAIDLLQPVAESENEAWMWRMLAGLEARAGLVEQASARVEKALAVDPRSAEWRQAKAEVLSRTGHYREAVALLEQLKTETGATTPALVNNLLWARLMASQLDDDAEREARRMTAEDKKNVTAAEVHTAAMVLLERGCVQDAAQLALRLQYLRSEEEMDDARWLLRGRLLSVLGFPAQGRVAFARMKGDEPELADLARRFQGESAPEKPSAGHE